MIARSAMHSGGPWFGDCADACQHWFDECNGLIPVLLREMTQQGAEPAV